MSASIGVYMPRSMFRNRALLDIAHDFAKCTNCGRQTPLGCEPAHSNLTLHGKATGQKSHDCFFAALCNPCHRWLDNQGGYGKDPSDRFEHSEEGKRRSEEHTSELQS